MAGLKNDLKTQSGHPTRMAMGPRVFAASSGLAPWNRAGIGDIKKMALSKPSYALGGHGGVSLSPSRSSNPIAGKCCITMTGYTRNTGESHAPPPPVGAGLAPRGATFPEKGFHQIQKNRKGHGSCRHAVTLWETRRSSSQIHGVRHQGRHGKKEAVPVTI